MRAGNQVWVSGTAPVADDGTVHAPGDAYGQAKRCLAIAARALADLDAGLEHVVRTRMFVTDISRWDAFGRAHAEAFGDHPPATSMIEVSRLIADGMLIEIELEAVL